MTTAAADTPADLIPAAVLADPNYKPQHGTWLVVEGLLHQWAERTPFWNTEIQKAAHALSGYGSGAGGQRLAKMLWFAGFRTIERKRSTGGYSYRWSRDPETPWPTEFNIPTFGRKDAGPTLEAIRQDGEALLPKASPTPLDLSKARDDRAAKAAAEAPTPAETDDDAELSLAAEQETRAIKAERNLVTARQDLEAEKRRHETTRRDLMVRIAAKDTRINEKDAEIERLRLLLQERRHERAEEAGGDSVLRRAKVAEDRVKELEETVQEIGNERGNLRRALNAEAEVEGLKRELAKVPPTVKAVPSGDSDWWPLQPVGGQTIAETMDGAKLFGLEVRVQARRKA